MADNPLPEESPSTSAADPPKSRVAHAVLPETQADVSQLSTLERMRMRRVITFAAVKGCGHYCEIEATRECCWCEDLREGDQDSRYLSYTDGIGITRCATRDAHYCPTCNVTGNGSDPLANRKGAAAAMFATINGFTSYLSQSDDALVELRSDLPPYLAAKFDFREIECFVNVMVHVPVELRLMIICGMFALETDDWPADDRIEAHQRNLVQDVPFLFSYAVVVTRVTEVVLELDLDSLTPETVKHRAVKKLMLKLMKQMVAGFVSGAFPVYLDAAAREETVARIMVGGSVEKMFDKILGKEMMIAERHRRKQAAKARRQREKEERQYQKLAATRNAARDERERLQRLEAMRNRPGGALLAKRRR